MLLPQHDHILRCAVHRVYAEVPVDVRIDQGTHALALPGVARHDALQPQVARVIPVIIVIAIGLVVRPAEHLRERTLGDGLPLCNPKLKGNPEDGVFRRFVVLRGHIDAHAAAIPARTQRFYRVKVPFFGINGIIANRGDIA